MRSVLAGVTALALLATSLTAAEPARPAPYLIDGKPIAFACLESVALGDSSRFDPVDLRRCGRGPGPKPGRAIRGMTGYDHEDDRGYFYYRHLGVVDGLDILFVLDSGGGTGSFTQLIGVRRRGSTLRLAREIAAGDRCNGGLANVALTGGRLTWDEEATPYDVIEAADAGVKAEAYKDLEASAASCVARIHRRDGQMTGVSLTDTALEDQPGWTDNYRHQACFNRQYRAAVGRGRTEMTPDQLRGFAKAFAAACLAKPK